MYVVIVTIEVIPEHVDAFIAASAANHRGTREEPGNLRFDVLRDRADPHRFYLYEVYRDEAALDAHKATEHYRVWNETVAPWMARPRSAVKCDSLQPEPWN